MAGLSQPGGSGASVPEGAERMVDGQGLVDVVEECGRLDEPAIRDQPGLGGSIGQERRHLRHHGDVLQQPCRWRHGHE